MITLKKIKKKNLQSIQSKIIGLILESDAHGVFINKRGDKLVRLKDSHLDYETFGVYFGKSLVIQFAESDNIYSVEQCENGEAFVHIITHCSQNDEIFEPEEDLLKAICKDSFDAVTTLKKLKFNQNQL